MKQNLPETTQELNESEQPVAALVTGKSTKKQNLLDFDLEGLQQWLQQIKTSKQFQTKIHKF